MTGADPLTWHDIVVVDGATIDAIAAHARRANGLYLRWLGSPAYCGRRSGIMGSVPTGSTTTLTSSSRKHP